MKSRIRIMGRLSVVLLICVLLGQGAWMYRVREMKVDEFRKTADYVLQDIIQIFLDNQAPFAIKKLKLGYSLANEDEFCWKYNNTEKRLKIFYMTQASIKPPTFVFFCNDAQLFHFSYQRYLENRIRESFGLEGTPVRIIIRERGDK